MANNVTLNSDGIIEINVVGDQNYASVIAMGRQAQRLLARQQDAGKPLLVLDDITKLGNSDIAARKAVADLARTLPYDKAVLLGDGSVLMRVGTNLLLRAAGKGRKIRYFENRAKAVAWLLSKK